MSPFHTQRRKFFRISEYLKYSSHFTEMNHSSPCKKYFDGIISINLESTRKLLHAPEKVNEILFLLVNTVAVLQFFRRAKNNETTEIRELPVFHL
jgi:hypothetical protein